MKTKKEILKSKHDGGHVWVDEVCYDGDIECVYDSMDEYSKEVAIEFAWWIIDHRLDFQPATPDGMYIGVNMENYNQHELFEQFKAEKGL